MRLKFTYTILTTLLLFGCLVLFTGNGDGPGNSGNAWIGAPGESGVTCGTCHSNPGAYGFVDIDIRLHSINGNAVTSYVPGNSYDITIIVNPEVGTPASYGFQAVALDVNNNNAGVFVSENEMIGVRMFDERFYAEHNMPSPSPDFTFRWEAPATDVGDVTFYASGSTNNGDGSADGDSGMGTTPAKLQISPNTALPIEMTLFTVEQSFNSILLKWATQTETNSSHFVLEHAPDGVDFKEFAIVSAAGFSTEIQRYSTYHSNPNNGLNYYRLKIVDLDGVFEYSNIIAYEIDKKQRPTLEALPNLVADKTTVLFQNNMGNVFDSELHVHTMSGQLVGTFPFGLAPGENRIELDLSRLELGYYSISLKEASEAVRILKN